MRSCIYQYPYYPSVKQTFSIKPRQLLSHTYAQAKVYVLHFWLIGKCEHHEVCQSVCQYMGVRVCFFLWNISLQGGEKNSFELPLREREKWQIEARCKYSLGPDSRCALLAQYRMASFISGRDCLLCHFYGSMTDFWIYFNIWFLVL